MEKKNIRIFNIKYSQDDIENILSNVKDVLDTAFLSNHEYCRKLEKKFEEICDTKYKAISCSSATSGLEAIFRYINIKNKAVLVQSNTFIATGHAIHSANGIVVPFDLNSEFVASLEDIKKAYLKCKELSIEIAALCIVNISGRMSQSIYEIQNFCKEEKIRLIEDNAQGMLSTLGKRQLGTFSDFSVTSFQTTKVVACGEGGLIMGKNPDEVDQLREYIFYGRDKSNGLFYVNESGNFKLSEMNAALALADLERSSFRIQRRREIDQKYKQSVNSKFFNFLEHPLSNNTSNYKTIFLAQRKEIREKIELHFKNNNVAMTGYVYKIPLHLQPRIFKNNNFVERELPYTEEFCNRHFTPPNYPELLQDEVEYIINVLNAFKLD